MFTWMVEKSWECSPGGWEWLPGWLKTPENGCLNGRKSLRMFTWRMEKSWEWLPGRWKNPENVYLNGEKSRKYWSEWWKIPENVYLEGGKILADGLKRGVYSGSSLTPLPRGGICLGRRPLKIVMINLLRSSSYKKQHAFYYSTTKEKIFIICGQFLHACCTYYSRK